MHPRSDYDIRQLNLMMKQLISFEKGDINLLSMQGSLEFLLQALEEVEETWEYEFMEEMTTIASINAKPPINNPIDINIIINDAVQNLKRLVALDLSPCSPIK